MLPVVGFLSHPEIQVDNFVYIFTTLVSVFLSVLNFFMLVRAVMSWLPIDEDSAFANFVYAMTEPIIIPIRMLLEKSETVRSMPIDLSFFIAFVLLSIVQTMLPTVR